MTKHEITSEKTSFFRAIQQEMAYRILQRPVFINLKIWNFTLPRVPKEIRTRIFLHCVYETNQVAIFTASATTLKHKKMWVREIDRQVISQLTDLVTLSILRDLFKDPLQ